MKKKKNRHDKTINQPTPGHNDRMSSKCSDHRRRSNIGSPAHAFSVILPRHVCEQKLASEIHIVDKQLPQQAWLGPSSRRRVSERFRTRAAQGVRSAQAVGAASEVQAGGRGGAAEDRGVTTS